MLIIPAIAAPLHRLELRKFLLPITQHMRFHRAEITDLTDGEIALAWYRWQLIIVRCFQHRLLPALSIFDPGGTSPPAEPYSGFLRPIWDCAQDSAFCRGD